MLTRSRLQRGEGELEEYNPEIGRRRVNQPSQMEEKEGGQSSELSVKDFQKLFLDMKAMVDELYAEKKKHKKGGSSKHKKQEDQKDTEEKAP